MFISADTQGRGNGIKDREVFKTQNKKAIANPAIWTLSGLVLAACAGGGGSSAEGATPPTSPTPPNSGAGFVLQDTLHPQFVFSVRDINPSEISYYGRAVGDLHVAYGDSGAPVSGGEYDFVDANGNLLAGGVTLFGTLSWADATAKNLGEWTYTPDATRIDAFFTGGAVSTGDIFHIRYTNDAEGADATMIRQYTVTITAPVLPPEKTEPELPDDLPTPGVAGQYIRYHIPDGDSGLPGGFYFFTDDGDGNLDDDVPNTPVNLQENAVLAGNDHFVLDGNINRDLDSSAGRDPNAAPSLTGGGGDDVYQVDLASIGNHRVKIVIADINVSNEVGAQNILVFTGHLGVEIAAVAVDPRDDGNNFSIRFYDDAVARAGANEVAVINIAFQSRPDFDIHYAGVDYTALDSADAAALQAALAADIV